jgi:Ca2+/Na+ antiporter
MTAIYINVAVAVLFMLSAFFIGERRITRIEGLIFLAVYCVYIYSLI